MDLLEQIQQQLASRKESLRSVSEQAGVPYHTLTKLAQGVTANPRYQTVKKLQQYFEKQAA